ncbi:MAG: hypothetical protein LUE65_07090 [Clostridiales bacterium]|nr:hypothetical protein [Clostridiales bacterium]
MWIIGLAAVVVVLAIVIRMYARNAKPGQETSEVSEQDCAVILSVICEELRAKPEELRITAIRKL